MRQLVMAGFVVGAVCIILGIIAKFTGGMLATVTAAGYLRFAWSIFLASLTVGVYALLEPKGGA
ncbi:MAG: hypothetical protein ACE5IM_09910 [Nitrospinota bacterium]